MTRITEIKVRGWRDVKPTIIQRYGVDRRTLAVMDEALPILEREAFREELKQLGPHGTTVRVTHDAFAFLEGNVITVDDLHFTAEDGDPALLFERDLNTGPVHFPHEKCRGHYAYF